MEDFLFQYKQLREVQLTPKDTQKRAIQHKEWLVSYTVIIIVSGKGAIALGDKTWIVEKGTVLFCNTQKMLTVDVAKGRQNSIEIEMISFEIVETIEQDNQTTAYQLFDQPWLADGVIMNLDIHQIAEVFDELKMLETNFEGNSRLRKTMLLYKILEIIKEVQVHIDPEGQEHWIQRVVDYMHRHYTDKITRDAMAALAGFHPRAFSILFREATGYHFTEYLAHIRITKVKEHLLLSRENLEVIANRVGYSNGLYLSRKFKQIAGISPTEFIRQPKRIVAYDWIGNLLALGITPVGGSYSLGLQELKILEDKLSGIIDVGRTSVDKVVDLSPDLIIAPNWLHIRLIKELQRIAPTLIVHYGDPFDLLRKIALILNRQDEADVFIRQYQLHAEQVKSEIGQVIKPGETVALYEYGQDSIWILNEFHGRGGYNLYKSLALNAPVKLQEHILGRKSVQNISICQLPEYAADHMIVCGFLDGQAGKETHLFLEHPIWKKIPAYSNNKVYLIDKRIFYPADVLSLKRQLDLQKQMFLA